MANTINALSMVIAVIAFISSMISMFGILTAFRTGRESIASYLIPIVFGVAMCGALMFQWKDDGEPQWEVTNTIPLVSLADNSEISGHIHGGFIAVSGEITEKQVYRFMTRNTDGSFSQMEVDASTVTITEDADKNNARIDTFTCTQQQTHVIYTDVTQTASCGSIQKIHIPQGSLSRDFTVDNQ